MSATAKDIEALLTGAPERVATLRAELREWADPEGLRRALDRLMPGAGENVPGGEPIEHDSRHWFAAPDRVREERAGGVTIRRGDRRRRALPGGRGTGGRVRRGARG